MPQINWSLFREVLVESLKIIILVVLGVLFLGLIYMFTGKTNPAKRIDFGLTFSQKFSEEMDVDWKKTYLAMLDELGVRKLRLVAYWDVIESEKGEYAFSDLDWQIREAKARGGKIVLAVGQRLPRWPECHFPSWAKELVESKRQEHLKALLAKIVEHYKDEKAIVAWQVENEPFLSTFGECPALDEDFLKEEIALVRSSDGRLHRPIIVTASGELSLWSKPSFLDIDVLGTSLYRIVWIKKLGTFKYPIPAIFYDKRWKLVSWLTGVKKHVIIELQAEPWSRKMIYETTIREQEKSMSVEKFREILEYAKQTGAEEAYLWGVEWWYQRKMAGNDALWAEAQKLWR